jgi:hypothetical protein
VRFVGYGDRDDEWFSEEDLIKTAPEEVNEFNKTRRGAAGGERKERQASEAKETGPPETEIGGSGDNGCKGRRESSARNGAAATRDARNSFTESAACVCTSSQVFAEMTAVRAKGIPGKRLENGRTDFEYSIL